MFKKLRVTLLGAMLASGVFSAQAANVTVKVAKSDGSDLSGVAVTYSASSHYTFGTTGVDGTAFKTFADGTYRLKVTYNGTSFTTNPMALAGDVTVNFATTGVTLNGYTSNGDAVSGMGSSYANGSWYNFGTTDASGKAIKELFPGSYSFRATYRNTMHTRTITVGGDGFSTGSSSSFDVYLSKLVYSAIGGTALSPISNVSVSYSSGSWTSFGTTDAMGTCNNQLFAGDYSFRASYKGTTANTTETVGGDGFSAGSTTNITGTLTHYTFTNSGGVIYNGGGSWQSVSTSGSNYAFPGTYKFKFRGLYLKDVTISGSEFHKSAAIIITKDNTGAAMMAGGIRGGIGSGFSTWHVNDTTTENGINVKIDLSNKSTNNTRSYEVSKNNSTKVITQDLMTNNVFNYQTNLLTLKLQTCAGAGISGGTARFGSGASFSTSHFPGGATNASGETYMQAFPGTFSFEMNVNSTAQVKSSVAFTGSESYTWNTTNLKLNYPGDIAYGGSGDSRYFNKPSMELLPGSYKFNFRTSGVVSSSNYSVITIPDASCTAIEKTPVIVRLVNSSNAPLEEGAVTYYLGGWSTACYTKANGNIAVLLNGNQTSITSAVVYNGSREQKSSVTIPSNAIVTYQTGTITMDLLDADGGHSLEGTNLTYYAGAWRTFGTGNTTGGSASIQLLPGTYSFRMNLNGSSKQINQNIGTTPLVQFNASSVKIHTTDNVGGDLPGATASYYTNGWYAMGTTDAGGNSNSVNFILGSTVTFKATKSSKSLQLNNVPITSAYQTVEIGLDIAPSFAKTTTDDDVLTEASESAGSIKLYPNPASTNINITIPSSTGTVEIYSMDGRRIAQQVIENGGAVVDVSSYTSGVYNVVLRYDGKSSAHKISKQ